MDRSTSLPDDAAPRRVLVAEDEDSIRTSVSAVLRKRGCDVHEAATVAEAIDILAELGEGLDIAVLDYFLPIGEPGTALGRAALEHCPKPSTAETITDVIYHRRIGAAVLFTTAHSPKSMRHVVCGTQAAWCLYKPFGLPEFLRVFERVSAWHRSRVNAEPSPTFSNQTPRAGAYRDGHLRILLRLAEVPPDDTEMRKVARTLIYGTGDVTTQAHESCGMAPSTYKRRKRRLQAALGVDNFASDLIRRIDDAIASGEIQASDLLALEGEGAE